MLDCGRGGVPSGCSPAISVSGPFLDSLDFPLGGEPETCFGGDVLPQGTLSASDTPLG